MVSTTPEINVRKNSEENYVKKNCLPHSKNDRSSSIGPCLASDNHSGAARKFKSMHITKLIMKQMLDQQKVFGITSKNNRNPPLDIQLLNQPGQEIGNPEQDSAIDKRSQCLRTFAYLLKMSSTSDRLNNVSLCECAHTHVSRGREGAGR
jgi:hypothetical protein